MKLIQVGVGGFGRSWVDIVGDSADWELARLVDISEGALAAARQASGLPEQACFGELGPALAAVESDAVLIVVPPEAHAPLTIEALEAGKHVLTEKPLADTLPNAQAMVDAAERAGRKLMVSQNYRFRSQARTISDLIRRRELGELGYVGISFHKAPRFEGSYRLKMEHPLLVDMSIHHFDLIRCLTGLDPIRISAHSWRPQWSWFDHQPALAVTIKMQQDVVVSYFASWVSKACETSWDADWRLQCADGVVLWSQGEIHRAREGEEPALVGPINMPVADRGYALVEFARAIREDDQPETSGADNMKSFAMVLAAVEAIEAGREVAIADLPAHG
ncbi:MAG: Gfo/Idh/MocA family protein [Armatimonadota bacterium]